MHGFPTVRQWQVVQTAPDVLQFRVVAPEPLTAAQRATLIKSAQDQVGGAMRIEVAPVDSIAATPSGKRRLTVAFAHAGGGAG